MAIIVNRRLPRMRLSTELKKQIAVQKGAELQFPDFTNKPTNFESYELDSRLVEVI